MAEIHDWRPFVYGGLASITAEFGTFPLDTTKTRLQIQGQKIDQTFSQMRYRGMTDAFVKILKEEGLQALYSGIWPAVLRQATYGTIKFGTYYTLKKYISKHRLYSDPETGNERVWLNVACAATAGAISSAIANPTDVLKVRMQVHGKGTQQHGLIGSFVNIYRYEGVRGLWRGVGPTSQRAVVIAATELPVYDYCKLQLMSTFGDHVANHFISSFIASLVSAIASTPIDVIRTRIMNQKHAIVKAVTTTNQSRMYAGGLNCAVQPPINVFKPTRTERLYAGSFDCAVQTVRNEGFMALYKGFIPTWLRMGPWNVIFFITYEQLKKN